MVLYSLSLGCRSFTVKSCLFLSTNLSTISTASFSKYRRILIERSLSSIGTPNGSGGGRLGPSSSSPNMSFFTTAVLVVVEPPFMFFLDDDDFDFLSEAAAGKASASVVTLAKTMRAMDSLSASWKAAFGRG